MAEFYQSLDRAGGFDYELYEFPPVHAHQSLRGPRISLDRPYLACVGAAQTFGRFAERPFPALLGEKLRLPALNLGVGGSGPRHFNRESYVRVLNDAELVVFQVLSGRSASNSLFDNRATGGISGEADGRADRITADEFFSDITRTRSQGELLRLIDETRRDYMAEFRDLLSKIRPPKLLLWLSQRTPDYDEDHNRLPFGMFGEFPQLVNRRMVEELRPFCDDYVEVVSQAGLPQRLWRASEAVKGTKLADGWLENEYYPSPEMHELAACRLQQACRRFVGTNSTASPTPSFVVTGPERSGTNLLIDLLNQHSGCYCGNEIFNSSSIENDRLTWRGLAESDRRALLDLRRLDPVAFLARLREIAEASGVTTIGFKLLYRQAVAQTEVLAHLQRSPSIRIVHVRRRNLMRRMVSERQARASRKWSAMVGEEVGPAPAVAFSLDEAIRSFLQVEAGGKATNEYFRDHEMLEVIYEDLAANPQKVASRVARFLGLPPARTLRVRLQKQGSGSLKDAVSGFEQLRGRFLHWSSFFEE